MNDLDQARLYTEKAQRKLNGGGCGCFGESVENKGRSAIELYHKAAVIYQREKKYPDSAKCLEEIAVLKERLGEDSNEDYIEAAHLYSFFNKEKSAELMQKSVKHYLATGKYSKSGEVFEKMAKYYEDEEKYESAISNYIKASDNYALISTGYKSKERNCSLKAADLMCIKVIDKNINNINNVVNDKETIHNWKDAVDIYENVGKGYLIDSMLRYNAKDMYFKIICLYLLYEDYIIAEAKINDFKGQDPSLSGSSECMFLEGIIESFKKNDKSLFESNIINYKQTNSASFDDWKKAIFNKLYNKIFTNNNSNISNNYNNKEEFINEDAIRNEYM